MIKILKATYLKDYIIKLDFSDGQSAAMDFSYLLNKNTVLTNPLKNIDFFKSFFLDFGALCWKNGLELSPEALYIKAKEMGILYKDKMVA